MAPRVKAEQTPTEEAKIIGEAEFKRLVKKLKAEESGISESKGRMGSAVENAVAKHNLHTDALRLTRKYMKKSPAAAAEFVLHLQTYFGYLGLGDPDEDLVETPEERRGKIAAVAAE
jgi:hypothetical protein